MPEISPDRMNVVLTNTTTKATIVQRRKVSLKKNESGEKLPKIEHHIRMNPEHVKA